MTEISIPSVRLVSTPIYFMHCPFDVPHICFIKLLVVEVGEGGCTETFGLDASPRGRRIDFC